MTKIFLTGATGYVGGQALHSLVAAFPASQVSISCLVREESKAQKVKDAFADRVRIVIGGLDDIAIVEAESQNADIVMQLADTKHIPSAQAIVRALSSDASTGSPRHYIQMSGASMFVVPEIKSGRFGEPSDKVWNDLEGSKAIEAEIRANPSREMDNFILSVDPTKVRTALISGPLIYGRGLGPVNQKSIQTPNIARKTITDGQGFHFARGLNAWANVHVQDLGGLFVKLVAAAMEGKPDGWNLDGVYLPAKGKMEFGHLSALVAQEAYKQGLIKSASSDRVIDADEANRGMHAGAIMWGTNAVFESKRAQKNLGWELVQPPLEETIQEVVETEAKQLGLK